MEITLKNYRCFQDSRPAHFEIKPGLTALLGANNSGKSSLLKFFHEFRALFQLIASPSPTFAFALDERNPPQGFPPQSILDHEELFSNLNTRGIEMVFDFDEPSQIKKGTETWPRPISLSISVPRPLAGFKAKVDFGSGLTGVTTNGFSGSTLGLPATGQSADFSSLCSEFRNLQEALYIGPFRNAINVGAKSDYYDIQVGQAFIGQWRAFKTGNLKRQNETILQVTEDIKRIFDFDQLDISPTDDNQTLQVFINKRSYKLHELGSGLAQFILVLGNAAIKQPSYILIDEPELNLHPSLMLDFVTTLASYARMGVIFGTHNMGLARSVAERIYSLRKIKEGETDVRLYEATVNLSEFLGELSFSGYQEIGGEKLLLVEGKTDVKTLQQFLRLYKMDHKIVPMPLFGKTLINAFAAEQLREIKRISPHTYALIDSERTAPDAPLDMDRQGFVKACEETGVVCHVLERRAIENYFPDSIIKHVIGDAHRALQPFEKLGQISPNWPKWDNWRIAREMTINDLNGTDLKQFLDSLCTG